MKKKLTGVTLLLATAFIASSCGSDVTYKEVNGGDKAGQSIIWSINANGSTEYYTADDLLHDLQDSATSRSKLYGEISRQVFTAYGEQKLSDSARQALKDDASDSIDEFKSDAKANAKEQGTDYDTYLEKALEDEGVSTLEELKDLYYYRSLKSDILEGFVEDNYEYFLQKYLTAYTPFQVKHILVAANSSDTNYKDGTMTVDNARKLLNVLNRFIDGDTFASIADLTDDTSSKDNGGIMPFNQAQNYVSEFRFAPYALELFGNAEEAADAEALYKKASDLHLTATVDDTLSEAKQAEQLQKSKDEWVDSNFYKQYKDGIGGVNYSSIVAALETNVQPYMAGAYNYYNYVELTDAASFDAETCVNGRYSEDGDLIGYSKAEAYVAGKTFKATPKAGVDLPTVAEQTYEMNVSKFDDNGDRNWRYYEEYELERNKVFNTTLNSHKAQYIVLDTAESQKTTNKVDVDVNGTKKTVLADNEGNPIYAVLASTGLHFMSNVHNSYDCTVEENNNYFRKFETSTPSGQTYESIYANTYIGQNGAYRNKTTLQSNWDKLLSDITSYVSTAEYYLFDAIAYSDIEELRGYKSGSNSEYIGAITVSFYDSELNDLVKDYVQNSISSTDDSFASSVKSAAESYASKLAREEEVKAQIDAWLYDNRKD